MGCIRGLVITFKKNFTSITVPKICLISNFVTIVLLILSLLDPWGSQTFLDYRFVFLTTSKKKNFFCILFFLFFIFIFFIFLYFYYFYFIFIFFSILFSIFFILFLFYFLFLQKKKKVLSAPSLFTCLCVISFFLNEVLSQRKMMVKKKKKNLYFNLIFIFIFINSFYFILFY